MDFVNGFGEKRGLKSQLLMHGRGYGDDGPLFTPQNRGGRNRVLPVQKECVFLRQPTAHTAGAAHPNRVIKKVCCFTPKPIAHSADGTFDTSWGGCVLVTENGGEPLV